MAAEERLHFHHEHSRPVMEKLHCWCTAQFEERKVEPNSGLGQAISYLFKHWENLDRTDTWKWPARNTFASDQGPNE